MRNFIFLSIFIWLGGTAQGSLFAQSARLPAKMKVAILTKMLDFTDISDKRLVAVVYSRSELKEWEQMQLGLEQAGFKVNSYEETLIPESIAAPVVYILPRTSEKHIRRFERTSKLILTDDETVLKNGFASFALVLYQNKPQILANMSHIEENGISIQAPFFRLVRTIN